jgi:predicted phosphate transport protein (TIGR00153 family)
MDWISYRDEPGIPEALQKDFFLLVDAVVEPIEELDRMVAAARTYFKRFREADRLRVKETIRNLRHLEHEADLVEDQLKRKVLQTIADATTVFHMVRLAEIIGSIADHVENAGDMMRAMVAK